MRSYEPSDVEGARLVVSATDDEAVNQHVYDGCLAAIPDGDLFIGISQGLASVVTDEIETFTEKGILLKSGQELEADLIVTATGFNLLVLGGIAFDVDGTAVINADDPGSRRSGSRSLD